MENATISELRKMREKINVEIKKKMEEEKIKYNGISKKMINKRKPIYERDLKIFKMRREKELSIKEISLLLNLSHAVVRYAIIKLTVLNWYPDILQEYIDNGYTLYIKNIKFGDYENWEDRMIARDLFRKAWHRKRIENLNFLKIEV